MNSDHERFTQMYDECRQRVWAYVVSRAGRQVAEEVVSETFAIAWRRWADVPQPPLTWLIGVARNVLRDNIRAQVRRDSLLAEMRSWSGEHAGDPTEAVAERESVLRALAGLGEDDRELLMLSAWHGLSVPEMAQVVGCRQATLRVRLHRARQRLAAARQAQEPLTPTAPVRVPSQEYS